MASTAPSPEAVLHLAALHTLASTGFASTSRAASLTLSSTLSRYLRLVATTCTERATLAGRNKVAAIDVVEALEDLGVGGVGELHAWAVGLDIEVGFVGHGLESLGEGLRDGLSVEEGLAEMKLVPNDELPKGEEEETGESDEDNMEVDGRDDIKDVKPIRFASPDMTWLPPLPDGETSQGIPGLTTLTTSEEHLDTNDALSAPPSSIIDRYRRRIPFGQSQLAATRPFVDPPNPPLSKPPPPAPSSFPALKTAFAATAGEPSVTMRQSALRSQATELLRRNIAAPDRYSPQDTLTSYIPPPRSTPIIPSHSDTVPPHFIPLNPNPTGLLSSLVHQMHSPYLPPALRERLTSVRPPQVQTRDNEPLLYGESIRGPGSAALARARGKQIDSEEADEGLLRATWPVPPRGIEKWGRNRLPTGKKVIQSGTGEDKPRLPEGAIRQQQSQPPQGQGQALTLNPPPGKIKLRLPGQGDGSASPGGGSGSVTAIQTTGLSPLPPNDNNTAAAAGSSTPALPTSATPATPATPSGPTAPGTSGIRLKLGVRRESTDPSMPIGNTNGNALAPPNGAASVRSLNGIKLSLSPKPPASAPSPSTSISLKLNTKSLSPMNAVPDARNAFPKNVGGMNGHPPTPTPEDEIVVVKREEGTGQNGYNGHTEEEEDEPLEESINAIRETA